MVESKYYRVDLEYIQRTSLLIAAESPDLANDLVRESIDPAVRGFHILATVEISEAEKTEMLDSLNQEGRTIN